MQRLWEWCEQRYPHLVSRPMLVALPAFFAGLFSAYSPLALLWVLPSLLFSKRALLLSLILLIAGFTRSHWPTAHGEPKIGDLSMTGFVLNTPTLTRTAQKFILQTDDGLVLVTCSPNQALGSGDYVEVQGNVRRIVPYSESKSLRADQYWLRRGVNRRCIAAWGGGVRIIEPGSGIAAIGSAWRTDTWEMLKAQLDPDRAGIAMGIVAGQQSLVSQQTVSEMQRAGTLHLLATSGYNVMLLVACVVGLLCLLPIHRVLQILIVLMALLVYVSAVGGKPPILRACISAAILLCALLFRRSPDVLSALAASAVVSALIEPASVFDAGYHLTFVILFMLCLYGPHVETRIRLLTRNARSNSRKMVTLWSLRFLLGTILCQLAAAPAVAAHFGSVSLISPVSNLLTWPAVPIVYVGVFLAQLVDPVSSQSSQFVSHWVTGPSTQWIASVNHALAAPDFASLTIAPIPGWFAVSIYVAAILLSKPMRHVHADDGATMRN